MSMTTIAQSPPRLKFKPSRGRTLTTATTGYCCTTALLVERKAGGGFLGIRGPLGTRISRCPDCCCHITPGELRDYPTAAPTHYCADCKMPWPAQQFGSGCNHCGSRVAPVPVDEPEPSEWDPHSVDIDQEVARA